MPKSLRKPGAILPAAARPDCPPKNFGFSDFAEAFVFLSGFSVVLAYSRRLETQGPSAESIPMLERAMRLYFVHILLTFMGLALVGAAFSINHAAAITLDAGRDSLVYDPYRAFPQFSR